MADAHGVPLAAAALQFPLMQPCVASVLPGIGDTRRLEQTLGHYRRAIPGAFWRDLVLQALIRADSVVPHREETI